MVNLEKLSENHQKWVKQLENDFADLPMGMAEALVRLWLKKPEFFKQENLDNIKNTTFFGRTKYLDYATLSIDFLPCLSRFRHSS
jgi:hypothetical protein